MPYEIARCHCVDCRPVGWNGLCRLQLSGAAGISGLTLNDTSNSGSSSDFTDLGFYASLGAGKEWWVSSNWGLGVAAVARLASLKLKDYDARLTATSISMLFTATYN